MIFDIQHFCTHDGPGIRTTVFLKGCPLHCAWCHNPESQSFRQEILVSPQKCIGCKECERVCPHHAPHRILASAQLRSELCGSCIACAEACPAEALEISGRRASVEEVLQEVLMDKDHYDNSTGGVTLSGGEPFASPAFTLPFLKAAKASGLHTAVETSGCCAPELYLEAAPYVDLFLWDIKMLDGELYERYTGGRLSTMLASLDAVCAAVPAERIRFRVLFIPDIHQGLTAQTAAFLAAHPSIEWEIIPYHVLGNSKREKLGREKVLFREPSADEVSGFGTALRSRISAIQAGR